MSKKRPIVWKNKHRGTCPDCLERDDLLGRWGRINQPARPGRFCETCGGQGAVTFAELVGGWPKGDLWVISRQKKL